MNLKLGNNECTFARWKVASLPMLVTLSFQVCIWLLYNDHENLLVIDQQINLHTAFQSNTLHTWCFQCNIIVHWSIILWHLHKRIQETALICSRTAGLDIFLDLWKNPEPCTKLKFMGVHFVEDVTAPRCAAHVGAEASRSFGSSLRHPPLLLLWQTHPSFTMFAALFTHNYSLFLFVRHIFSVRFWCGFHVHQIHPNIHAVTIFLIMIIAFLVVTFFYYCRDVRGLNFPTEHQNIEHRHRLHLHLHYRHYHHHHHHHH